MKYAQIRELDISNGEGIGVALFVQGCEFYCEGCFNSSTWDFNGGQPYTPEIHKILESYADNDYISRISILGGEPLHPKNVHDVYSFCAYFKNKLPDKKIWLYTGYTFEEIINKSMNDTKDDKCRFKLLSYIDVLVDGRYDKTKKDINLNYKGSTNQRIINIPKTLNSDEIVLLDIK